MSKKPAHYDNMQINFSTVLYDIMGSEEHKNRLEQYYTIKIHSPLTGEELRNEYWNRLAILQNKSAISFEDIALVTGVKKSTVSRWLQPVNPAIPDITIVTRLHEVFNVPTDYLLGVAELEDKEEQLEYEIFKKYNLDHKAFHNLYQLKSESMEQYMYVIEGLNLLLKQKDTPFGILNRIGNYLLVTRMEGGYYFYDEDDMDDLIDLLQTDNMSNEEIKKSLEDFKNYHCTPFSMNTVNQGMLEKIVDEIVKYKKEVTPEFFNQPDNIDHLFTRKTNNEEKTEDNPHPNNGETTPEE